jgi:hypothetical protein
MGLIRWAGMACTVDRGGSIAAREVRRRPRAAANRAELMTPLAHFRPSAPAARSKRLLRFWRTSILAEILPWRSYAGQ